MYSIHYDLLNPHITTLIEFINRLCSLMAYIGFSILQPLSKRLTQLYRCSHGKYSDMPHSLIPLFQNFTMRTQHATYTNSNNPPYIRIPYTFTPCIPLRHMFTRTIFLTDSCLNDFLLSSSRINRYISSLSSESTPTTTFFFIRITHLFVVTFL